MRCSEQTWEEGGYLEYLLGNGLTQKIKMLPEARRQQTDALVRSGEIDALPEILGKDFLGDIQSALTLRSPAPGLQGSALVKEINLRLQILYRAWLTKRNPGLSPEEPAHLKLNALLQENTRGLVEQLLQHINLKAIAELINPGMDERFLRKLLQQGDLNIQGVDFRITYWCNIACEHCFLDANPQRARDRIQDDQIFKIIDSMPSAGLNQIMVGAGEPFVRPDQIASIIAAGRKNKVVGIALISNGFWGKKLARAKKVCAQLAEAGFMLGIFDSLKISTGLYHIKAGVPVAAIGNIALAFFEQFGVKVLFDCETHCTADGQAVQDELDELGIPRHTYTLMFRNIAAIGAGLQLMDKVTRLFPHQEIGACGAIDKVAIDPNGKVLPCCGGNYNATALVTSVEGSAYTRPLRELVQNIWTNPLMQFMARNPMGKLFEIVGVKPSPQGYTGPCMLCTDVFKDIGVEDRTHLLNKLQREADYFPHWLVDV